MTDIRELIMEEIRLVIVESRVGDFYNKYSSSIPQSISTVFIEKDPSKTHKYLDWMGRVVSQEIGEKTFDQSDANELMGLLGLFDRKVRGVDINSFKDLDSFTEYMEKVSGQKSKRAEIEGEGTLLFLNDHYRIFAPVTHRACRFFGGSTKWCIATSNMGFWDEYYNEEGNSIVIVIDRISREKYAIVQRGGYGDLERASIYDTEDHLLGQFERKEFLGLLKNEVDADGENALEKVVDYIEYDDSSDRVSEYEQQRLQDEFERGGRDDVERNLIREIKKEVGIVDLEDNWKDIVKKVFGNEDKYEIFLGHIWWDTANYHGNDSAGYFRNLEDLKKSLDSGSNDGEYVDKLVNMVRGFYGFLGDIGNVIRTVIDDDVYSAFINQWGSDFSEAVKEISSYLDRTINNPAQVLFPFGKKLKNTPGSFKELLKIMRKLGYNEMVEDLTILASGEYDKENPMGYISPYGR